jgi:hypothetical protein
VLAAVHSSVRSQFKFSNPALNLAKVRLQRQFIDLNVDDLGEVPVEELFEFLVEELDVPGDMARAACDKVRPLSLRDTHIERPLSLRDTHIERPLSLRDTQRERLLSHCVIHAERGSSLTA